MFKHHRTGMRMGSLGALYCACVAAACFAAASATWAVTPDVGAPAPAFNKLGAVILGISVDDVASHKQFAEKHRPFGSRRKTLRVGRSEG